MKIHIWYDSDGSIGGAHISLARAIEAFRAALSPRELKGITGYETDWIDQVELDEESGITLYGGLAV